MFDVINPIAGSHMDRLPGQDRLRGDLSTEAGRLRRKIEEERREAERKRRDPADQRARANGEARDAAEREADVEERARAEAQREACEQVIIR